MNAINGELRAKYAPEDLDKNRETLIEAVKKGIRKGSEKEQILASETIPLIAITLAGQTDSENLFKDFHPLLVEVINITENESVKSAVSNISRSIIPLLITIN